MFTYEDFKFRSLLIINSWEEHKSVRLANGMLAIDKVDESGNKKCITSIAFCKLFAVIIIGRTTISSALVEACKKENVSLIVTSMNLNQIFSVTNFAEGNYPLRMCQYRGNGMLDAAKALMKNKFENQLLLLLRSKKKDGKTLLAIESCENAISKLPIVDKTETLLGIEGNVQKLYFAAYFQDFDFKGRSPHTQYDELNSILDFGYTILFNLVDCFVGLFGFDPYCGVYHKLFFKRKSLVCDIMEPFRCIIDYTIRNAFKKGIFKKTDFVFEQGKFRIKKESFLLYSKEFVDKLLNHKLEILRYVNEYRRNFLKSKDYAFYNAYKFVA